MNFCIFAENRQAMAKTIDNEYGKSIQTICDCGNIINDSSIFTELQKNVFLDLLYRIKRNCFSLGRLTEIEDDYLAIRLLHRSIFEDLITIFFFLSLKDNPSEFDNALAVMDVNSKRSIEQWIKVHKKIDNKNASAKGNSVVSQKDYFNSFNTFVKQHPLSLNVVESKSNDITVNNKKFTGTPGAMKSCSKGKEVGELIKYMYTEYQFLSQIEHYSLFNRGFSYDHPEDETITIHKNVIDFFINYLLVEISDCCNKQNNI